MKLMKLLAQFSFLITITHLMAFEDPSIDANALKEVWDDEIPKHGRYYKFELNGVNFKGTRRWDERWNIISNATSFKYKRVLELGANIGMCSTFISKYLPIKSVTALEHSRFWVEKCKQIQDVFNVNYPVHCLDLDKDNYEKILGYDYDIVLCMSLYHWVADTDRLMAYLSNFPEIIYEGHDSEEIEIKRFEAVGFSHYQILGYGKGYRPIFLLRK